MKRLITQLALLIAVLCASVQAYAYDCKVDGIYYNLNSSDWTAEVTYGDENYKWTITIPESITYEGASYSVTSIGDNAFFNCSKLRTVTIPNSVTSIGEFAFHYCSGLTSVTIPNSVTNIGDWAFISCSGLTSVTIPASVTSIGYSVFEGCTGLTSVTIPNSVTSIGGWAFEGCTGLTSVTIPNSVTSIGDWAFEDCSGLKSVSIGNSVTSIGYSAFDGCKSLTKLYSAARRPPVCGDYALTYIDKSKCTLYVLKESVNLYKVADQWKGFYNISEYDGVDDITVDADDAETLYDVYNVQGVKVGGGLRRADMSDVLPHGIYILVSPNATRKIRL